MTGTELKCQQRAHASTTALEKPLPGSLFPSMLWFKPEPQKAQQDKTWLTAAQPTACRFIVTIQESGNLLEKVFWRFSPQEKGSSRNSLVGHASTKASLGEGERQALTHVKSSHTSAARRVQRAFAIT